jgi:hypothetical protein
MENKDKVKMFEMSLEGYTLDEIGKSFGIAKERVKRILANVASREAAIKRDCENMLYPNIAKWLKENDVSIKELNVKMGHRSTNSEILKLNKLLHGINTFGMRMGDIKKILDITGMTFEEAFAEERSTDER